MRTGRFVVADAVTGIVTVEVREIGEDVVRVQKDSDEDKLMAHAKASGWIV